MAPVPQIWIPLERRALGNWSVPGGWSVPRVFTTPWATAPFTLLQATSVLALAAKDWQGPDWELMPQLSPHLQALCRALGENLQRDLRSSRRFPSAGPWAVCSTSLSLTFLICRVEVGFIAKILRGSGGTFYKMPGPLQVLSRWELLRVVPWTVAACCYFCLAAISSLSFSARNASPSYHTLPVTISLLTQPLWTWYLLGDDVEWQLSRKL